MPYDLDEIFPRRQPEPPYRNWLWLDLVILLALVLIIGLVCTKCSGQTVSPVSVEGKGPRVRGEFSLTNNLIIPMGLTIEPQSMSIDASTGKPLYRHLDANVTVKLDATSARLGPKQSYVVGYEVTCSVMPCVINLNPTFTGLKTKDGLAIALHLPHVVYVCAKQKGCRDSVRQSWGLK